MTCDFAACLHTQTTILHTKINANAFISEFFVNIFYLFPGLQCFYGSLCAF